MEKRSKVILCIWNILLIVTIPLCLSCSRQNNTLNSTGIKDTTLLEYNYGEYNIHTTWEQVDEILKFEYSGHQYIQFNNHQTHAISISIVHDPNCPCH